MGKQAVGCWQAWFSCQIFSPGEGYIDGSLALGDLGLLCPGSEGGSASQRGRKKCREAWPGLLTSLSPAEDRSEAAAAALNLTTSSIGSISMSVDIDGTTYAGEGGSWSFEGGSSEPPTGPACHPCV